MKTFGLENTVRAYALQVLKESVAGSSQGARKSLELDLIPRIASRVVMKSSEGGICISSGSASGFTMNVYDTVEEAEKALREWILKSPTTRVGFSLKGEG